jgi:hypothetical protein
LCSRRENSILQLEGEQERAKSEVEETRKERKSVGEGRK